VSTKPHEDRPYLSKDDTAFLTKARITSWEANKTFSSDWAAEHFFTWAELLHQLRDKRVRILEIGSWEGRSALFFLNYLPQSRIVCVDPFDGNVEHSRDPYWVELARKSESQFDSTLAAFPDRVEKIKGNSADILPKLGISGRRFDLAYIDGNNGNVIKFVLHAGANTPADLATSFTDGLAMNQSPTGTRKNQKGLTLPP